MAWCHECDAWCKFSNKRAWRLVHRPGMCTSDRLLRSGDTSEGSTGQPARAHDTLLAMARQFAANASAVGASAAGDMVVFKVLPGGLGGHATFGHLPRAGCHEELLQCAAAKRVLLIASVVITTMCSPDGRTRQDGRTCKDAGAIPYTLDSRGTDADEAAKEALWRQMLTVVGVSADMHSEHDRWVLGFARKIAGHGHSAPALSLHPPGNVSKVHQHLLSVLHFLLQGTKRWFLWRPHAFTQGVDGPPLLSEQAHKRAGLPGSSELAMSQAGDLVKLGKYLCTHVVQQAGTMLYLPAGWYHFVVSDGVADATSVAGAFCVSLVSWLATPHLRTTSYLLAVDDAVWEDQTPPDDEAATTYPHRPLKRPRPDIRTLRISAAAARRRHNEAVMQHCRNEVWPNQ